MSLNAKLSIFSLAMVSALLASGFFYYQKIHPKPAPIEPRKEIDITIIPGWNLRQVAENWTAKGLIKSASELYYYTGEPACIFSRANPQACPRPLGLESVVSAYSVLGEEIGNYEGYLFPDTYRVYADAKVDEVLDKVFANLQTKLSDEEIKNAIADFIPPGSKKPAGLENILIMASLMEKEARTPKDMAMVADIFWRRLQKNWALQSCASVNYVTGKNDPGVSAKDKSVESPYNTYKYPGLPPGPICNPGLNAIQATIFPQPNDYWYFMTGTDGVMRYARTLDEHNYNVAKYLR